MRPLLGTLVLAVVGCASHPPTTGTLHGDFRLRAGPGQNALVPGEVTITADDGSTRKVIVRLDGRFTVRLRPGTYRLTGRTPNYTVNHEPGLCTDREPVVVTAGRIVTATVECL